MSGSSPPRARWTARCGRRRCSAPTWAPGQPRRRRLEVNCGVGGKGRWSDSKTWTYLLSALAPGERCDFRLKPGLKAANGEAVQGEPAYAFFAPGPWVRSATGAGAGIEEDQAFSSR